MNVRAVAAFVLVDVIVDGQSLPRALASAMGKLNDSSDQRLLKEICYGTLRWYFRLNAVALKLLNKPLKAKDQDIHFLILIGLYQLSHLSVAAHAVLSETVEATRDLKKDWAKGLVNAVLRNFQRKGTDIVSQLDTDSAAFHAHPRWLFKEIKTAWPQFWQNIIKENNAYPPMSLRVNARKYDRASYLSKLSDQKIGANALEYSPDGFKLTDPMPVESIPEFRDGVVSVQDEAAQLAAGLLQVESGHRVLDACAAPGGKTCHLLEREPAPGKLAVLDIAAPRLQQISENLDRLHLADTQSITLLQGDASDTDRKWWDGVLFDRILLDAACSATGVIRRHPDIKVLRKQQDISALVERQAAMLDVLWGVLKPGGILLYATCSILPQENHKQIQAFLSRQDDAEEDVIDARWGHPLEAGRQILSGESNMDGFYYARIKKKVDV